MVFSKKFSNCTEKDVLFQPYTEEQIRKMGMDANGEIQYIAGFVPIDVSSLIGLNDEEFFDMLSEKLVGNCCLSDIDYCVAGVIDDFQIIVRVTGYPECVIDWDDEGDC